MGLLQQKLVNHNVCNYQNLLTEISCTVDRVGPEPLHIGDCAAVVTAKVEEYVECGFSSENGIEIIGDSDIEGDTTRSNSKRSRRPSASDVAESVRANKVQKRFLSTSDVGNADAGREDDLDSSEVEDDGDGEGSGCEREDDVDGDGPLLAFGSKIVQKIRSGLEKIRKEPSAEDIKVWSPGDDKMPRDLSLYIESNLRNQASALTKTAKTTSWLLMYLASCYALWRRNTGNSEICPAGDAQTATTQDMKSAEKSTRTYDRWRSVAYMVNLIIDGLSRHWGLKADLVSHALAGNDQKTPVVMIY